MTLNEIFISALKKKLEMSHLDKIQMTIYVFCDFVNFNIINLVSRTKLFIMKA